MQRDHITALASRDQPRRRIRRCVSILVMTLAAFPCAVRPSMAQQPNTVAGRVIDQASRSGLAGISVSLSGRAPTLTDETGHFGFVNVVPGRYFLTVQGLGYVPRDIDLDVAADTSLTIELEVAPVPLDTLHVHVREIEIQGRVHEVRSGAWLSDAEVFATPDIEKTTDLIGRFTLKKVPSGVPLTIRVQSFGYLPKTTTFLPRRDTTVEFDLAEDPVVQRMIAQQVQRIDERSAEHRYKPLPVLDRDELLTIRNWPLRIILRQRLHLPLSCVVIDENEIMASWRYMWILPEEVHHVEVVEVPGPRRTLMVRIYTRDFIRDMVLGRKELLPANITMSRVARRCR